MISLHGGTYHALMVSCGERVAAALRRRSVRGNAVGLHTSDSYMTAKLNQMFITDSVVVRFAHCLSRQNVDGQVNGTQAQYVRWQPVDMVEGHIYGA